MCRSKFLLWFFCLVFFLPLHAQDTTGLAMQLSQLEAAQEPPVVMALLREVQQRCAASDDLLNYIQAAKKAGVSLDEAGHYDAAIQAYKQADELHLFRPPASREEWEALGWLYVNAAFTHAWYGHFYEAKNWYEAARAVFEEHAEVSPTVAAYLHRELGNIYTRFGDHAAAHVLLDEVRRVALAAGDNDLAAQAMNDIAIAQADTGNDSLAAQTCRQALALEGLSPVSVCLLEGTLAMSLSKTGARKEARRHALKGLQFCRRVVAERLHPSGNYWLSNLHKQLGELSEEPQEALAHFYRALELLKAHFPDTLRREVAKVHLLMGDFFLRQNDPLRALMHQQSALQAVLYQFAEGDPAVNPPASSFYPENSIIEALDGKARSWTLRYRQTGELGHLQRALDCYRLLFEAARIYRRVHHFEASSLAVVAEVNRRTAAALDLLREYARTVPGSVIAEDAFRFMEQSRSVMLYEALRQSEAGTFANVPDSLLHKEQQLNSQIAELDKALFFAKQTGKNAAEVRETEAEAFRLRQQLASLLTGIEQDYPAFYQLKYSPDSISLSGAQRLLTHHQVLLDFFPAEGQLYVLLLRSDTAIFHWLPVTGDLNQQVAEFRKVIERFQFPGSDKASLCEAYTRQATALYGLLLKPLESELREQLIIVPGGLLGLMPFGALLTEMPAEKCRFRDYPYLIKKHSIAFSYSVALMRELRRHTNRNPDGGLALAPAFNGGGGFGALQFNQASAREVAGMMNGRCLLGPEANRRNFEQLASGVSWLYLSTHAQANNQAGEFSFFALSGNEEVYDSLYARELYALHIPAELVFLGACETAAGNWQQGEGINSLARAFLYAGSRSIVTTLWSINDESNSRLTKAFFSSLKTGMAKDQALRAAQLQHLESVPQDLYAHPVYWAAYIAIGNMEPLPQRRYPWGLLLGLAAVAGLAAWWRNRAKRSVKGLAH